MKKLLILMLVLGMVSMANAALTLKFTSDAAGTNEIASVGYNTNFYMIISGLVASDLSASAFNVADQAESFYNTVGSDLADYTGSNNTLFGNGNGYAAAGNQAGIGSLTTYDSIAITAMDQYDEVQVGTDWVAKTINDPIDGEWFSIQLLSGDTEGTATLGIVSSGWDGYDVSASIYIPEPMTIALLGLGGLFLRRRK